MTVTTDGRSGLAARAGRRRSRPAFGHGFDVARRLDPLKVGIGAACLLVVALGLLPALAMRPFTVIDENAHTSYALQVASGSLPTMRSPTRPLIPGMGRQKTYVANHPPLYYGVAGVPMRLGVAVGKPVGGFLLGRLVTLGFMTSAVLAIALLARAAVPSRPGLAIAASAVVAAVPFIASTGAQIANDSAAMATTAAVLVLGVAVLREPTRRRIVALSVACVVAALTRSTGLEVAVLAAAAAGVAVARQAAGRQAVGRSAAGRGRIVAPAVAVLAVLLPVLLTSGWFYLRNRHLYGDLVGAKYALALFPGPHLGLHQTLFAGGFWTGQLRQLFTRPQYVTGVVLLLGRIVVAVLAVGLLALLVRGVLAGRRSPHRPSATAISIALLLAAQVLLSLAAQLDYLSRGGFAYVRYALPAFPVLALVAGAALLAIPFGRRGPFVVLVVGLLSFVSVLVLSKGIAFRHPGWERYGILERYRVGLSANGIPVPSIVLTLLLVLVVVAIAGLAWSLARTTRTTRTGAEV